MTAATRGDLLLREPFSAVPWLLVLLLVVAVLAREVRRTRAAGAADRTTRRLTWAVRILAPVVLVLLMARLLVLG